MSDSKLTRRGLLAGTAAGAGVATLPAVRPAAAAANIAPAPSPSSSRLQDVVLQVNGRRLALAIEPRTSLLDALREQAGLTGTKKGCDRGSCGACTVHIDGRRVVSCLTLAVRGAGARDHDHRGPRP